MPKKDKLVRRKDIQSIQAGGDKRQCQPGSSDRWQTVVVLEDLLIHYYYLFNHHNPQTTFLLNNPQNPPQALCSLANGGKCWRRGEKESCSCAFD